MVGDIDKIQVMKKELMIKAIFYLPMHYINNTKPYMDYTQWHNNNGGEF